MGLEGFCGETSDGGKNFVGCLLPANGLGMSVVSFQEIFDGLDEGADGVVAAPLDLALGKQPKPSLYLIEPGGVGWGKVQVITRVLEQPALNQSAFVGGVVIQYQVHFLVCGHTLVDQFQKGAELLAAMFGKATTNNFAGLDVQGGKETGDPVAKIVWGPSLHGAGAQRQDGLAAAQGLDLALFVDTEDEGIGWRTEIEPNDVAHFGDELRIARKDKAVLAMGLETKRPPDPTDRSLAHLDFLGHLTGAPMRCALGSALQGFRDDLLDPIISNPPGSTHARFIIEPIESTLQKALAPKTHSRLGRAQSSRDRRVLQPLATAQNNQSPKGNAASSTSLSTQSFQFFDGSRFQFNTLGAATFHDAQNTGPAFSYQPFMTQDTRSGMFSKK
jgi:hypothetical protein